MIRCHTDGSLTCKPKPAVSFSLALIVILKVFCAAKMLLLELLGNLVIASVAVTATVIATAHVAIIITTTINIHYCYYYYYYYS